MSTVQTQDVLPVRSRVSWSAIFAGAVVALATYLLLSTLGVALGFTVSSQVGDKELSIGVVTWAVITTLVSLFLGGLVTSALAVGETKTEAAIYGIIVWGVVFASLLWMLAGGVRLGFNAVMGVASTPSATVVTARLTDRDLEAVGFTPQEITDRRAQFDQLRARNQNLSTEMRNVAEDPRTIQAAWWTFGGIFLSMLASVAGALTGSGPTLTLAAARVRATILTNEFPAQERQTVVPR